ncbi:MAG: hypothetical protein JWO23_1765 [Solirubrobacterales bacterium]|jgi:hypothetical protein|nr:hypothetical protein [Solirubrobacterales bacterium]MCW3026460.1 hypothetical protein [Solirubrobacterales bacterium]
MSTDLMVPADVVADVRESLFCLLGGAAEAIVHSLEQPQREYHPEWFRADRRELEDALALLDIAGWDAALDSQATGLELARYGPTLKQAVDGYLPVLEDQEAEADLSDELRVAERKPPRKSEIVERVTRFRKFATLVDQRLADPRE